MKYRNINVDNGLFKLIWLEIRRCKLSPVENRSGNKKYFEKFKVTITNLCERTENQAVLIASVSIGLD